MTKKVYELAKELHITSKELMEKAQNLGIDVKSHMNTLSDAEIEKILGNSKRQTKIIKADLRNKGPKEKEDPKVTVKAAVRTTRPGRPRPPMGRPVIDKAFLESKRRPPVGKPVVNKEELAGRQSAAEAAKLTAASKSAPASESVPMAGSVPAAALMQKETPEPGAETRPEAGSVPAAALMQKEASEPGAEARPAPGARPAQKGAAQGARAEGRPETKAAPYRERSFSKPRAGASDRKDDKEARTSSVRHGRRHEDKRTEKRDDRKSERGGREGRDHRIERSGKEVRAKRNGHGERNGRGERGGREGAYNRTARRERPQGEKLENKPFRRDDVNKKRYEKETGKYEKLERRSLEKQVRRKYIKLKPSMPSEVIEARELPEGTVVLDVPITVAGFCEQTDVSTSKVIMTLMRLGIMANINQNIDEDTVQILSSELGLSVVIGRVEEELDEAGLELFDDEESDLRERPPVITVMGHVDHGKTSLLDAIRKTNVTARESGGITQQIGASEVKVNGQKIVFLDTPGHEAFAAMRARGAHITDIAVLVVAADDSVKPQTVESINHAKAAGVPIIVAINKIDKPDADPEKVKQDLTEYGVLVEEWGGDVISVPVSAKTGEGIVNLLEMILLESEMMELRANPNRLAMGSVIEARLDSTKGPVATLLVTNGTLQTGQSVVAGTCSGKVRLMTDYKGKTIKKAGPATAVEILGLTEVPLAGDEFNAVKEDRIAREIAENRKEKMREEILAKKARTTLEELFSQIKEGEVKELNLIIKGDVQGSIGALVSSLEKLNNENVKVNCIHTGVGTVTESDVMLAETTDSIIIGFNVRPSTSVQTMADRENIQIRTYTVIYDVIEDVENAMKGMLEPEFKEEILGKAEIRNTFKVSGVGTVGGVYVTEGKVLRNASIRLLRDGVVIHEGKVSSLKRFKDDAREVAQGYECGLGIENYNDIKEGDIIECFHMVEAPRKP